MGVLKNGVGRPSNETIKKRNILKLVCALLALIIIVLVVYILNDKFDLMQSKDVKKQNENVVTTKKADDNEWYESKGTAKDLTLYGVRQEKDEFSDAYMKITDNEKDAYATGYESPKKLNTYKCNNSDCYVGGYFSYDMKTVMIYDGDYIIYNFNNNKSKKVNLGKYKEKLNYLSDEKNRCSDEFETICIETKLAGKQSYYEFNVFTEFGKVLGIINPNGEPIFFLTDDELKDNDILSATSIERNNLNYLDNGNVVYGYNNRVYTYDLNKNKLIKGKKYDKIVTIDRGYITVVDSDKYLKVFDTNNKKLASLAKITDEMDIHTALSGWYSQDKKEGIYVVVADPSVKWDELSEEMRNGDKENPGYDLGYEYYYIPKTQETGKIATFIGGYAKPILYLYPTKDKTNISVSFKKPEILTTTYPKFKNEWNVVANKNGDLYDSNNKYYYGLYWEEKGSINVDFKTGFYVTKENAISFLEEKLAKIGLNDREKNEFIMYWLPILEKNKKSLVYFELTNSRENYNKLIINPKPDSLLRFAIHIKKVNKKQSIKEQKIPSFERKGFTAVEWGGVIH